MRTVAIAFTVVLLFSVGITQTQVKEPRTAAIAKRDAPVPKTVHGQFTRSKAMTVIYGNYSAKLGSSTVHDLSDYAPQLGKGEGVIRVTLDAAYSESTVNYRLLVTYAVPSGYSFDCHPCAPSESAFLFEQHGNEWSLKNTGYDLPVGGGLGKPTPVKLIKVGALRHGLIAQSYYMAQGEASEELTIFLPSSDGFAEVFNVTTISDNLGNCKVRGVDCSRETAAVEFVPDPKKEIWGIRVTQREVVNGKVLTAVKVFTYEFISGKYKIKQ
jgi:hypothetical protein